MSAPRSRLRPLLVLAASALAIGAVPSAPAAASACANAKLAPTRPNLDEVSGATLCLLNRVRARHHLRPLRANSALDRAARRHSADMVAHRLFSHTSSNGTDLVARLRRVRYLRPSSAWSVGENIAYGTGSAAVASEIVASWMGSPPHRHNILTESFREIGIGVVTGVPERGDDGARGATYTTDFGRR